MRETTLRQLIFEAVNVSLKQEALTKTEIHELTDYILDNSILELSAEKISLVEGNYFGIGEYNKDRTFTLPRFITFELTRPSAFDMLNLNKSKTWKLRSHDTFEELENYLTYLLNSKPVVFIDGSQTDYELVGKEAWGYEVKWIGCKAAYVVTFVANGINEKEIINSKIQLQRRLIELVGQNAEDIQAYNVVQGNNLPFEVQGRLYSSDKAQDKEPCLIWCTNTNEENEEVF
jgi:hypothetical protein